MTIDLNNTQPETSLKISIPFVPKSGLSDSSITTAYKYFTSKADAENFAKNGGIWFPGVNQNRLFNDRNDPNEYYSHVTNGSITSTATVFGLYSLSLTDKPPEEWVGKENYYVKITDMPAFIYALYNDLPQYLHKISWLEKQKLLEMARQYDAEDQVLTALGIKYTPIEKKETLQFHLSGILLRRIKYQEGDAFNKHPDFSRENEIRLELCATSLLTLDDHNPEPSLYQLVKYIKCTCPSIKPYCSVNAINP